MFDEDVDAFFDDFAVKATYGTETRDVLASLPEEIFAGDQVVTGKYHITYKSGYFIGLKYGEEITVDGVDYTVDTVTAIDDGALKIAQLSKV